MLDVVLVFGCRFKFVFWFCCFWLLFVVLCCFVCLQAGGVFGLLFCFAFDVWWLLRLLILCDFVFAFVAECLCFV